jgi:hypothetical protein
MALPPASFKILANSALPGVMICVMCLSAGIHVHGLASVKQIQSSVLPAVVMCSMGVLAGIYVHGPASCVW